MRSYKSYLFTRFIDAVIEISKSVVILAIVFGLLLFMAERVGLPVFR